MISAYLGNKLQRFPGSTLLLVHYCCLLEILLVVNFEYLHVQTCFFAAMLIASSSARSQNFRYTISFLKSSEDTAPLLSCIYWCWWELCYWFLHICFIIRLCFFLVAFEISLYHNICEISLYCDWGYLYIYVHMCNFPSYVGKYLIGLFACQLICISILGNLSALTWNISFLLSFYFLMELE